MLLRFPLVWEPLVFVPTCWRVNVPEVASVELLTVHPLATLKLVMLYLPAALIEPGPATTV